MTTRYKDAATNMSIDQDVDYRQKKELYLRRLARKRLILADEKCAPSECRYSTLWAGLKLNHERNVGLVEPVLFLSRRFIFALFVTVLAPWKLANVLGFMVCNLCVLAYSLHEH